MFAADKPIEAKPCDCKGVTPCQCENCQCKPEAKPVKAIPQNRMLMFTATWCGPCSIWKRDEVPTLQASGWNIGGNSSAEIQYIDYDQNLDLVRKYGVTFVPVFVMVRPDGSEIARTGYLGSVEMADFWNRYQETGE